MQMQQQEFHLHTKKTDQFFTQTVKAFRVIQKSLNFIKNKDGDRFRQHIKCVKQRGQPSEENGHLYTAYFRKKPI